MNLAAARALRELYDYYPCMSGCDHPGHPCPSCRRAEYLYQVVRAQLTKRPELAAALERVLSRVSSAVNFTDDPEGARQHQEDVAVLREVLA